MSNEELDNIVYPLMKRIRESGYLNLNTEGSGERSLESQLRYYILNSRETEPHDNLMEMIEEGQTTPYSFGIRTVDITNNQKTIYNFHCQDYMNTVSIKTLDVTIDGNTFSFPAIPTLLSADLAKELHQFKFPKYHKHNASNEILPDELRQRKGI